MGTKHSNHSKNHNNNRIKRSNTVTPSSSNVTLLGISCPLCNLNFPPDTPVDRINRHLIQCGQNHLEIENKETCKTYTDSEDYTLNKSIFKYSKEYLNIITKIIKETDLNKKVEDLQKVIKTKKISWEEGCCQMNISRNELLDESMKEIDKVDIFKELKINFKGEICYDAGGIFREWFTNIFKNLQKRELGIFIVSDSNDFSYIINPFLKQNERNLNYFSFIGKLMGKALLDNITLNVCFNKIIYKMILQEKIDFEDLVFIDTPLYNSLKNLKLDFGTLDENSDVFEALEMYYSLEIKDNNGKLHTFSLLENKDGSNILVRNINDYIDKRIKFLIGLYEPFIKKIRESLFKILPKDKIFQFTSDEFELLVDGRPYIDLEEWEMYTEYKQPYNSEHKVIRWFWEVLRNLTQKELSNFLLFCTGSSRVPLGGFQLLESNRGNISKFTIEHVNYVNGVKNFVKAHTCFNRIDLPEYKDKEELREAIKFVSMNEIMGFGID